MNTEINTTEIIDTDLFTGDPSELETTEEFTVEGVVSDLLEGTDGEFTPYSIWKLMKGVYEIMDIPFTRPSQMMYTYDRNGLVVKGKKGVKRYTRDEVEAFLVRFINKNQ